MTLSTNGRGRGFLPVLLCLMATTAVAQQQSGHQNPQHPNRQQDPDHAGARTDESSSRSTDPVQRAHEQLQRATLEALRQQAGEWRTGANAGSSSTGDATGTEQGTPDAAGRGATGASPAGETSTSTAGSAMAGRLQADELMIAACPNGLLAGAPFADGARRSMRGERGNASGRSAGDATGETDEDRRQQAGDGSRAGNSSNHEIAGLILVSEDGAARGQGRRSARGDASTGERGDVSVGGDRIDRSAPAARPGKGRLQPGVYAVECSGSRVALKDRSGNIVLNATVAPSGSMRPASTETDRSTTARPDWEMVFGAITAEVMTSWNQHVGSPSSGR
ncbi:MAG: hypothetical protein KDE27_24920 [Planctomycetes bacterium]|nr:hypothetical protein [Planctomycetota bacterium]